MSDVLVVTKARFGPVQVESDRGWVPCEFSARFNGKEVVGTYDPQRTRNTNLSGGIKAFVFVGGMEIQLTLHNNAPNDITGEAQELV